MRTALLPSILLLTFISQHSLVNSLPRADDIDRWRETGQYEWSDACKGEQQSPIDLTPEKAEAVNYDKITFHNYNLEGPVVVENDGHTGTVRGFLTWEHPPSITGGNLNGTYFLRQVNFRWANGHTFSGMDYPAEVHLVHISDQSNPGKQEGVSGNIAVVAVPVLAGENEPKLEELKPMYEEKGDISPYSGSRDVVLFNPRVLLPWDISTYYRYNGPPTTPPCAEDGVIWTVMQSPIILSSGQLNALKKAHLRGEQKTVHRIRNSQPVQGRKLYLNRKVKTREAMKRIAVVRRGSNGGTTWSPPPMSKEDAAVLDFFIRTTLVFYAVLALLAILIMGIVGLCVHKGIIPDDLSFF